MPGLPQRQRLPVTLLSGFLGSGKTTLLEHILTSPDHGLKIGVIVNDVGALNIDAALLSNHEITSKQEEVVAMQNGCICCTLRGDLLEEVARLAEDGKVDYLVIESTGISEPMQVAETFSEEFAEMHIAAAAGLQEETPKLASILAAGGLSKVARLDTCVTLIDAVNFMSDYDTADFLVDRHAKDDVPEEDDRNISDLQTDQVEFADVIVINKCDLVSKEEVKRVKAVIKSLNHSAKVLTSVQSKLDIKEILDTKLFSYEKAALGAGWLKSLQEEINPETEEYGIGTFVYRARRPFHPTRFWLTIKQVFVVIQESYINDGIEEGEGMAMSEGGSDTEDEVMDVDKDQPQLNPKARLASKRADPTFGPLLRSKGFLWLASRPRMYGEWSQAGVMATLSGGSVWRCLLPECDWPDSKEVREAIRKDFEGEWGDRRQELVFIGQQMKEGGGEARIRAKLDECLLNDEEWEQCQEAMRSDNAEAKLAELFEDGFEDWREEEAHDHDHEGHTH